jgi:hypothetical protein
MERKTAKIVSRVGVPHPYGVEIVEGELTGVVFCLARKPSEPEGCYVVVEFNPADQFAEIVP